MQVFSKLPAVLIGDSHFARIREEDYPENLDIQQVIRVNSYIQVWGDRIDYGLINRGRKPRVVIFSLGAIT